MGEQLAIESERLPRDEENELTFHTEENERVIGELESEVTSVTQEVENYRANLESVQQELDDLCFENSHGQNRILEGTGRRMTLLRSNGDLTVVGVT